MRREIGCLCRLSHPFLRLVYLLIEQGVFAAERIALLHHVSHELILFCFRHHERTV